MLRIGEFSSLTGISIFMLRNYDKIGLLKPEQVDDFTGYRYYSVKQIVYANRIQVLKSMGFGLKEIMDVKEFSDDMMRNLITNKMNEKREEIDKIEMQLNQMQRALEDFNFKNECALSVCVKKLPARKIVSFRACIHKFEEEGLLWSRLDSECKKYRVRLADIRYSFAITHEIDFEKQCIDTEVQRIVDRTMNDIGELKFMEVPETEVAAVAYKGIYSKIGGINSYMYRWIEENDYTVNGKSFHTYYVSPENENNPNNFITEVCFPITKKH